jgi:hypothetical protein
VSSILIYRIQIQHVQNSIVNNQSIVNERFHFHSFVIIGRDIDPRDPIFIWNFVFYSDVSISPFVKRGDMNTLLERRVSLYSQ